MFSSGYNRTIEYNSYMSIKLDLHVHSEGSWDCETVTQQFERILSTGILDQIAITDHDEIKAALKIQDKLGGERIIVGEEVTTQGGPHLIGLFLNKFVPRGLSILRTAELIKAQGGLVYAPHPYMYKWGVGKEGLDALSKAKMLDIVEGFNAWEYKFVANLRGRKQHNIDAWQYAVENKLAVAASTDSHTEDSLGNAYSEVAEVATKQNLVGMLQNTDSYKKTYNKLTSQAIRQGVRTVQQILIHRGMPIQGK